MRIFTRPIPEKRLRAACFAGLSVLLAFSLFHVWRNLFIEPGAEPGLDFRLPWLAGKLWLEGKNPYGSAFVERYVALFNNSVNMYWSYPPSWLPISAILGLFSFETAFRLWMATDMLLLTGGTLLLTHSVASRSPSRVWLVFMAALTFACSMQATEIALYIGQTSCVVFFGLAAVISGLLNSTPLLLIVGLFLTALKPHVGLVAFVSVFALPGRRWTCVAAGALSFAAAAGVGDIPNTLRGFLANLKLYANPGNTLNNPENLTGMTNIVNALFNTPSLAWASVFFALVAALGGFVALHFYRDFELANDDTGKRLSLIAFLSVTLLFVPLHAYDMIPLTLVLILSLFVNSGWKWPMLTATLLCHHPRVLAEHIGFVNPHRQGFPESLFVSVMLIVILASSIAAVVARRTVIDRAHARSAGGPLGQS
jgi:hypothetical protein